MDNKLFINTQTKRIILDCSQILYCQAENSYTKIFLKDETAILVSMVLHRVHENLPSGSFCRCHRSYIVNKIEVHSYDKLRKCLSLKCGIEVPVSRRMSKNLFEVVFKNIST